MIKWLRKKRRVTANHRKKLINQSTIRLLISLIQSQTQLKKMKEKSECRETILGRGMLKLLVSKAPTISSTVITEVEAEAEEVVVAEVVTEEVMVTKMITTTMVITEVVVEVMEATAVEAVVIITTLIKAIKKTLEEEAEVTTSSKEVTEEVTTSQEETEVIEAAITRTDSPETLSNDL